MNNIGLAASSFGLKGISSVSSSDISKENRYLDGGFSALKIVKKRWGISDKKRTP
ncbi:hypothetical protein [Staphylococcus pseudintermedius]|uniref:hypothetical protein n=1 Tax=Staphylococcus pseudintermedius TaxID=283734 RepID=UPI001A9ACBD5|nr:hypothetical protein [Staphylococcus pseudintermedius]EJG5441617.1 hypothetical protein [Staphylococcus pseudintermedius]MDK3948975.1 hypothetical protein [Staphylococcus pseudintermedius]HCT0482464.1 hypothetical protein [Staphylococcus pseudintermedius]